MKVIVLALAFAAVFESLFPVIAPHFMEAVASGTFKGR